MSGTVLELAGQRLQADLSGALFWPAERLLAVADLHLEKGSSLAARGTLLPPYDSRATLRRLAGVMRRYAPARVVCLGDSFHDSGAPERLDEEDRKHLCELTRRCDWVWIAGNHDPDPPPGIAGRTAGELRLGPLVFRHRATVPAFPGEISGHFHPKAAVRVRGRFLQGRCFATDGRRLILPAFGAYAGGLDVLDPALRAVLGAGFYVHLMGRRRLHLIHGARLARPAPR